MLAALSERGDTFSGHEMPELPMRPMTPQRFNTFLDIHLESVVAGDPQASQGGNLTRLPFRTGEIAILGKPSEIIATRRYRIDVGSVADVASFVDQVFSMRMNVASAFDDPRIVTMGEIDERQKENDRERQSFLADHYDIASKALARFLAA